jgi:hypothetical protein
MAEPTKTDLESKIRLWIKGKMGQPDLHHFQNEKSL